MFPVDCHSFNVLHVVVFSASKILSPAPKVQLSPGNTLLLSSEGLPLLPLSSQPPI